MLVDVENALEAGNPGITLQQEIIAKGCGGDSKNNQKSRTPSVLPKRSQTKSVDHHQNQNSYKDQILAKP